MSEKIQKLLDEIQQLTLLEASELVKGLEDRFGVSAAAAAPVAVAGPAGPAAEEVEEQTEFSVILIGFGDGKKINTIKVVREVTSLGLKEAKDLVDSAPKPVREGIPKDEAEALKKKFEEAGATVELK